MEILYTTKKP